MIFMIFQGGAVISISIPTAPHNNICERGDPLLRESRIKELKNVSDEQIQIPYDKVWFKATKPACFIDVYEKVHELEPNKVYKILKIHAEVLEKGGFGYILTNPDDIVKEVFLKRVKVRDSHNILKGDVGGADAHLELSNTTDQIPHHETGELRPHQGGGLDYELRYLERIEDLEAEEFIYSENYTDIEPSKRLIELAEQIGYLETEFVGVIRDYFGFECNNPHKRHRSYYPIVEGGYLNPYLRQRGSRESAKNLAIKLIQLNYKAKVLERDRKTGVLKELDKNNLYLIKMELTYPPELDDLFLPMLCNLQRFYNLRKKAVDLFLERLLKLEFGEYADFSEFINWQNSHDWSSKEPFKPNFHEHLNLPNVTFDWRGSEEYKTLYRALTSTLTPTIEDIIDYTGWSESKVRRWLNFFIGKGLIIPAKLKGRKRFYAPKYAPIPSPLIRFNPKKFTTEKLEEYQKIWKEVIEEVFNVKLDRLPVIHLPDDLIPLNMENYERIVHRLAYCSRHPVTDINNYLRDHPNADFDLKWLKHLLEFRPKMVGSRIAKKLSRYTGIEFLSTLQGRYNRERKRKFELLEELTELEDRERELLNQKRYANFTDLEEFIRFDELMAKIDRELKEIADRRAKVEKELEKLFELEEKVKELREKYKHYPKCPICGETMHPISDKPSEDAPIVWFDPVTKKWIIKVKRRWDKLGLVG